MDISNPLVKEPVNLFLELLIHNLKEVRHFLWVFIHLLNVFACLELLESIFVRFLRAFYQKHLHVCVLGQTYQ